MRIGVSVWWQSYDSGAGVRLGVRGSGEQCCEPDDGECAHGR